MNPAKWVEFWWIS